MSTRATSPPRRHTTTLPVAEPAGRSAPQNGPSDPGTSWARTTGAGDAIPAVTLTPVTSSESPPAARWTEVANCRGEVLAPTVTVHGATWFMVPAAGPAFPAAAFTTTSAPYADRNPSSTGSSYQVPPEIE